MCRQDALVHRGLSDLALILLSGVFFAELRGRSDSAASNRQLGRRGTTAAHHVAPGGSIHVHPAPERHPNLQRALPMLHPKPKTLFCYWFSGSWV